MRAILLGCSVLSVDADTPYEPSFACGTSEDGIMSARLVAVYI
jgi:hypothetical protein